VADIKQLAPQTGRRLKEDSTTANVADLTENMDTNLTALLAKIIAAPSTEAKQDDIITALGLLGTEAKLEAVRALLAGTLTTQLTGSYEQLLTLANAVAITDTATHVYDLVTHGGLTMAEIRQYKNFKISFYNTHNQNATVGVYQANPAFSASTYAISGGLLYTEADVMIATAGRLVLQPLAGGTGVDSKIKVIPALASIFSNLYITVSYAVAPTSGAVTIKIEMN